MSEERGKEYCKLLLPLVSCLERWIVCLLLRRTRYCATSYPPAAKVFLHLLLIFPFVLFFFNSSSSQHRRCRSRPVIAVLPGCNRSGTSKEVLLGKSEPLQRPLRRNTRKSESLLFDFAICFFCVICLRLLIV